jgi:hypothetical protein
VKTKALEDGLRGEKLKHNPGKILLETENKQHIQYNCEYVSGIYLGIYFS